MTVAPTGPVRVAQLEPPYAVTWMRGVEAASFQAAEAIKEMAEAYATKMRVSTARLTVTWHDTNLEFAEAIWLLQGAGTRGPRESRHAHMARRRLAAEQRLLARRKARR